MTRRRLIHILKSRRARRWVILGALAIVAATFFFAAAAATLARGAPAWWRTVSREDPATIETARRVEEGLTRLLTRGRPMEEEGGKPGVWRSEPWSFRVQASEANAWLNVRLRLWLANRDEEFVWPDELHELQVDFHDGKVRLGASVQVGEREQIVSATLDPTLRAGSLFTPAQWVHLGRLGVPANWVLEAAGPDAGGYIPVHLRDLPETEAMFHAFLGDAPMFRNAVIKIGPGRRVRILKITPDNGALIVSCITEVQ